MAADPRPHGLSQLGVCEPGAIDRNPHMERSMGKHGTRGPIAALRVISILTLIVAALLWAPTAAPGQAPAGRPDAPAGRADAPVGTLTVAVATFGNERWLPHLYVGAEDVVLKPLWENLLSRDGKGNLIPMLAEKWQVSDGGRTWKLHLRKGVHFHNGTELTAEDVKFTFASLAREGSANSLAPEFRTIKSMEVEGPYAITIRFDKPFVTLGNRVTQGLFASVAYRSEEHTSELQS